jgi:spore maturation protein SpmA
MGIVALAASLLFAALLGVTRADASLTKAADVADLSRPALQLPAVASYEPSRFGFAEDLALLAPESTPGRLGLFGLETRRFERTYARNNPIKYLDPDGKLTLSSFVWASQLAHGDPATVHAAQWAPAYIAGMAAAAAVAAGGIALVPEMIAMAPAVAAAAGEASLAFTTTHSTTTAVSLGLTEAAVAYYKGVGANIGQEVQVASGGMAAIAGKVSALGLSQGAAAQATEAAVKSLGYNTAGIGKVGGSLVVMSVQTGANQPVLIVEASGLVVKARATLQMINGKMVPTDLVR